MDSKERVELRQKGERVRDGKYRSRAHSKTEKRKQRKACKKKKLEGGEKSENTHEPKIQEVPEPQRAQQAKNPQSPVASTLSRGKYLVKLAKLNSKRKSETEEKNEPAAKIPRKRVDVAAVRKTSTAVNRTDRPAFKEINRALLTVDKTKKIGSGTFGNCYLAVYRNDFKVVVKEMKNVDSPQEVLREAAAITGIGDHWGVPHLFGVCTKKAPHYLVLQFHALHSQSVTLLKAASEGVMKSVANCAAILKQTCEVLKHIHARGFLHNDLKGNNVVIDGAENKPVVIDFGKSCKIVKAKLQKPKVNVDRAIKKYPHIAPEIHRGQKQSIASDVFSFGVLITRLFREAKLEIPPALNEIAMKCQCLNPGKRPKLADVFKILTKLS